MRVRFYAELGDLLPSGWRGRDVERTVAPRQSVKDLIESMGVPHTEVDVVLVDGRSVDFGHQLMDGERVSVYPVFESLDVGPVSRLRPRPLRVTRFAADVHLGRLARYLRVVGFDTLYRNDWADEELVTAAVHERRIILTRDRGLLKRAEVDRGYLVRATAPRAQLTEVVERFDLRGSLRPYSRCPACNGEVASAAKSEIASELPPRTAEHYQEFWRCSVCGRLFWKGGHQRFLAALVAEAGPTEPRED